MKNLNIILVACSVLLVLSCSKKNDVSANKPPIVTISSIFPTTGGCDTIITITGTNFSDYAPADTVKFNGVQAVVKTATKTTITAVVPFSSGTGPVTVTTYISKPATGPVFTYHTVTNVIFAGADGPDVVYWRNGIEHVVYSYPGTVNDFTQGPAVSSMAISDTDVYIAGYGEYWKNGVEHGLNITSLGIAVSGKDVYTAGENQPLGLFQYVKNDTYYTLPGVYFPYSNTALVAGTDIYFAGGDSYSSKITTERPVYWKNGIEYILPTISSGKYGAVFAMAVSGADVYFAGQDNYNAVYWKNGVEYTLPIVSSIPSANVTGMAIAGTDVYFAGNDAGNPVYWKNGTETVLPLANAGDNSKFANAIAIEGNDVYIAGTEAYFPSGSFFASTFTAVYWKNGKVYTLPIQRSAGLNGLGNQGGPNAVAIQIK